MSAAPIVLIDPEADAEWSLAKRLDRQGYSVLAIRDAADGARTALAAPPAAVIADLWMPSISGVQLTRLLQAEPATEHVPVILRGPDTPRSHFWAERAGASSYVVKGRMGDLVRALDASIARAPRADDFFTSFADEDIRDRIATHLDQALFESVLAADVRALGTCGAFDRLLDLFSQFASRVLSYRWIAIATESPLQLGLHTSPQGREAAEAEARRVLGVDGGSLVVVEDGDAHEADPNRAPIVKAIELGGMRLGRLALSLAAPEEPADESMIAIIARELAGPIRIASLVEEAQRLATVDPLTGLRNRRAFLESFEREVARSSRYGHHLSLLLLDVDRFKSINDRFGHATGDAVLEALGRSIVGIGRSSDLAARWGGEEFVIALTSTPIAGAQVFAERLREAIAGLTVHAANGVRVPITASIGVAAYTPGVGADAMIARADAAMYRAKASGRDCVALHEPAPEAISAPRSDAS